MLLFLGWNVTKNRKNLRRRNIIDFATWPLWLQVAETITHILKDCQLARAFMVGNLKCKGDKN